MTGKFVKTEKPTARSAEEPKETGFSYAVNNLRKRNAAARAMAGLGNGYGGGDIHDE
mgnify:FL=1